MLSRFIYCIFLLLIGCFANKKIESPTIYISNFSNQPIQDIRINFPSGDILSLPFIAPGNSRSMAFNLAKNDDFFGKIEIFWKSSEGLNRNREFYLMTKNLPSIADPKSFNYLEFFIEQDDLEVLSSDSPDLAAKSKRMDNLLKKFAENYQNGRSEILDYSLIRVYPKKSEPIPRTTLDRQW